MGVKFRRQCPIGNYIVDFVSYEARLVVEVDGGQHSESESDKARDGWIESQGFKVLRFWNNEVLGNIEGVLDLIIKEISPSPTPLPSREGKGEVLNLIPMGSKRAKRLNGKGAKKQLPFPKGFRKIPSGFLRNLPSCPLSVLPICYVTSIVFIETLLRSISPSPISCPILT
jgi:hypothetical protein